MTPDLAHILVEILRLTLVMAVALFLPLLIQLYLLLILGATFRKLAHKTAHRLADFLELVGVVIHEFSHAAVALITLARVHAVKPLFDGKHDASVQFSGGNLLTSVLGGLAPLFGGLTTLWLIGHYVIPDFEIPAVALPTFDLTTMTLGSMVVEILRFLGKYFEAVFRGLLHLPWSQWRTYAGLYFALSVSSCIAPSSVDLRLVKRALPAVLGVLILVVSLVYVLGDVSHWFEAVQARLLPRLLGFSTMVGTAFALTFFGMLLFLPFRVMRSLRVEREEPPAAGRKKRPRR